MALDPRLRAICSMTVPTAREEAGLHAHDGVPQDLSPDGVHRGLGTLGTGGTYPDPFDEAYASASEAALRVRFGELQLHRSDPGLHIANLDPSCYDRDYAPAEQRDAARRAHLRAWPDAVDAAIESLDRVPAQQAEAAIGTALGLAAHTGGDPAAQAALDRLVAHLRDAARGTGPPIAMGGAALARLLGAHEATDVDLTELAGRADAERALWRERLAEACARIDPSAPMDRTVHALLQDHPPADGVVPLAAALVGEALAWAADRDLVPWLDGECLVGPTPPAQSWQIATMTCAAPHEDDGPSWFRVTPPDPSWPAEQQAQWLTNYSRAGLANMVIHEAVPGHFAHGRARRRARGDVRRTLASETFTEGWAHYTEQLALEEGFRDGDPRFAASVARDALLRNTRLACVIGLHTGAMERDEVVHRHRTDAFMPPHTARVAVGRVLRDPMTMSYTWGRMAVLDLRERARERWGAGFSLPRFHRALLDLGAPPIGLLDTALERG